MFTRAMWVYRPAFSSTLCEPETQTTRGMKNYYLSTHCRVLQGWRVRQILLNFRLKYGHTKDDADFLRTRKYIINNYTSSKPCTDMGCTNLLYYGAVFIVDIISYCNVLSCPSTVTDVSDDYGIIRRTSWAIAGH